jgi:hypothetical protein
MKKTKKVAMVLCSSLLVTGTVMARDFMIYPAQGQSHQQMDSDKYQCYGWAKNNSGFDPMQASAPVAQQQSQQGGVLRGGARGAAFGAAIGAIAGDAGKGAAIGAASGGMLGGMRRRDSQRQADQMNQQAQQSYNAARNNYDRAYSACLEGKGYTVK